MKTTTLDTVGTLRKSTNKGGKMLMILRLFRYFIDVKLKINRYVDIVEVDGSSPLSPTIFTSVAQYTKAAFPANASQKNHGKTPTLVFLALIFFASAAHASDFSPFPKWQPVREWLLSQHYPPSVALKESTVTQINTAINKYPFKSDKRDFWKTPTEFKRDGGGDCEDYAIAKMHELAKRGVPLAAMEIWVVKFKHSTLFSHAVLVVDGLVLDNQAENVYSTRALLEMADPIYAINVDGWREL